MGCRLRLRVAGNNPNMKLDNTLFKFPEKNTSFVRNDPTQWSLELVVLSGDSNPMGITIIVPKLALERLRPVNGRGLTDSQ